LLLSTLFPYTTLFRSTADFTVTIGFAKAGLIADGALNFVGRLEVVPLPDLHSPDKKAKQIIVSPPAFHGLLPRRKYSAYKNQFGDRKSTRLNSSHEWI